MKDSIAQWSRHWALSRGVTFWFASETDSTNNRGKEDFTTSVHTHPEPILYLTEHQTQGRGRGTNHWYDAGKGGALLSSWSFPTILPPQPILVHLVGLTVFQAAKNIWPNLPWALKLPNDLFIGDRKVGGILIDNIEIGEIRRSIIGLGMNVQAYPTELPDATSLKANLPPDQGLMEDDWHRFLDDLFPRLQEALKKGVKSELSETDRLQLLEALNANPRLEKKLIDIDSLGQPQYES